MSACCPEPWRFCAIASAWLLAVALLGACAPVEPPSAPRADAVRPRSPAQRPPVDPTEPWLLSDASDLRLFIYRGGRLARLGHNHVIRAFFMEGEARVPALSANTLEGARMSLVIPVDHLQLDRPEWRREAGEAFASHLSAKDIEATRRNMLGDQLLSAAEFPEVRVSGWLDGSNAEVRMTVRGQSHVYRVPVTVTQGERDLVVEGAMSMSHADFGLTPFSVLLGALRVEPQIDARFRLVWVRPGTEPIPQGR